MYYFYFCVAYNKLYFLQIHLPFTCTCTHLPSLSYLFFFVTKGATTDEGNCCPFSMIQVAMYSSE